MRSIKFVQLINAFEGLKRIKWTGIIFVISRLSNKPIFTVLIGTAWAVL